MSDKRLLFKNSEEIKDHYRLTQPEFDRLKGLGLPVVKIGRSWWGWKPNLDSFMAQLLAKQREIDTD